MKSAIDKNRSYAEKYTQKISNPDVPKEVREIINKNKIKSLIDLGCGDGVLVHALSKEFPKVSVTGVDISERRINGLKKKFPGGVFYCRDVCSTGIKKKFDFVYSSQVIEHVEDDKKMVSEMKKLLSKRGFLFVSSVIKKPFGVYKYRNKGKFVLDPTHEREYKNVRDFLDIFKRDFRLIRFWIVPVKRKILKISFRVPGYYLVYGIWKKRK